MSGDDLVDHLSPPIHRPNAEYWLATIREDLERGEAWSARWQSQATPAARKQISAVRQALVKLGPRAASAVSRQLDRGLAEAFPRLLTFSSPDFEPGICIPRDDLLQTLVTALERASADLKERPPGDGGKLSLPAVYAARSLIALYCAAHEKPFPTLSKRTMAPAIFALRCLQAWKVTGAGNGLTERGLMKRIRNRP
jgi:hypothetical protein